MVLFLIFRLILKHKINTEDSKQLRLNVKGEEMLGIQNQIPNDALILCSWGENIQYPKNRGEKLEKKGKRVKIGVTEIQNAPREKRTVHKNVSMAKTVQR